MVDWPPTIDADGHVLERQQDIRKYLEAPWNRRQTGLWPSDQPFEVLYLTVWMDGHVGHPAEYQFSVNDRGASHTRAANFVFKKVSPGVHTFSLQIWTAFGSASGVSVPTMEILHR